MVKWADKWQMKFNPEVIHFGRSNLTRKYSMNGRTLGSSVEQRDLGVFVHRSLKAEVHVSRVVKRAYGTLAFISRGIDYKSREVMLELCRTLVRPQLEYCVQFWSPHYRKDVIALERVQRRFTRMLPGMEHLNYEEVGSAWVVFIGAEKTEGAT